MKSKPADHSKDFYLISELASVLKVSTHTIRNLESEFGIEVKKDFSGKRIYTFYDIEKYRQIIEKKNSFDVSHRINTSKVSSSVNTDLSIPEQKIISPVQKNYPNVNSNNDVKLGSFESIKYSFKSLFNFSIISKFSLATFIFSSIFSYGSFYLDPLLDLNSELSNFLGINTSQVSNVLQSTDENWDYRFDVNVPAYFNNSLTGSSASFDLITVGDRVIISPTGILAPNIINTVRTLPDEEILLVDITDPNNPLFSITNSPTFDELTVSTLNGVETLDDTTIQTIQDNLDIPGATTDAETIGGLSPSDFLRSNTNTVFSNGIMTFDASSSLKFNNLNPNTFLKLDSSNNLVGYEILPGLNVDFTSTANSLTINVATGASTSQNFNSLAVTSLFLGSSSFDINNLILSSANEINKLYTLPGNLLTDSSILTLYPNIDTDASNDITSSNLASSILSAFPNIDTNSTNDVLISSLASLMLSNYVNLDTDSTNDITTLNFTSTLFSLFPLIDTNASDDSVILQDAVLIGSNAGKDVYSSNVWYGYQNFNVASASIFQVETNGKIQFDGGVLPSVTDNSMYSYDDVLYFQNNPIALLSDHTINNHNNRFAFFTTNAFGKLQLSGSANVGLSYLQSGPASSILGMDGSTLRYLNVTGDLTVTTTSSSNITFRLNDVNSDTGTFGSSLAIPQITVNSKGLITSVSTIPFSIVTNPNNFVSSISFSTPQASQRALILQRQGLTDLTALFTINSSDITTALNYTPLKNTSDTLIGNLGVTGNFSSANASFTGLTSQNANITNLTLANALSVIYGGTGNIDTPTAGQLLIGNGTGYTLSYLTAGTNVSISTGAGSVTISSIDTTGPNNYVTGVSFSDASSTIKTLTLTREGLSNLTASFSLSAENITSALGYTPFNAADFTAANITNALGYIPQPNLGYTPLDSAAFTAVNITNALGYVPFGPSNFIAGTNVTLSSTATSLTINAVAGGTNANNFVTGINFSDASSTIKTLTLTREGLSNLTASFSLSAANITSALGYTPFNSNDFNAQNITNALGYVPFGPSNFIAGTNVTLSSTATSITINSSFTDTTNANNYVTAISFSTPVAGERILNLSRFGLSTLTADFELFPDDITTALGYIPLSNTSDSMSGSLGVAGSFSAASGSFSSLSLSNALGVIYGGTGLSDLPNAGQLLIGNGTGYTLSYLTAGTNVSISTGAGSVTISSIDTTGPNNYVTGVSFSDASSTIKTLTLTREGLSNLTASFSLSAENITSALGYIPQPNLGYIPLDSAAFTAVNITNALGYVPFGPSNFIAGTNITLSSTATSLTINSSFTDTTNPNNYVTGISFSDAASNIKTLTLTREGLANLTASFSLTSSDIITGLGYTPLKNTSDTLSGNLTITSSLSAASIYQNGYQVCDLSGNCIGTGGGILGAGDAGFISLFTATNSIANSSIYQSLANGYIGIGTTNPGEQLDVYGAIKLSRNMGTEARNDALYQDNGVLYWNGQVVGVVGSTAPGGISGTKDYIPYFNTDNTLIASELFYESGTTERSIELVAQTLIPTYLGIGQKGDYSLKLGVAADTSAFYTIYDSEDDVALMNTSTLSTSDLFFALENNLGKIMFMFGRGSQQSAPFAMTFNTAAYRGSLGINTTNPTTQLDVIGSARITETLAAGVFSSPSASNFVFLSGGNFNGNLSAGSANLTGLTLANALGVNYGGTGITNIPAVGQVLIGNGTGYTLSTLTGGTNVSITTGAGSIVINSIDTTNPNNYVTAISFSIPAVAQRALILSREGLSDLTASFSLSSSDITTALGYIPQPNLGYTPLDSAAFTAVNITNALGYVPLGPSNFIAGTNITLSSTATSLTINSSLTDTTGPNNYVTDASFSDASSTIKTLTLTREGLSNLTASFSLSAENITSALGYTPLRNTTDTLVGNLGVTGNFSSANASFTGLFTQNANISNLTLANALSVIYGGTGNIDTPTAGQLLIGNGIGYTLSYLTAGTNVSISTGAGSITISSIDTTNPNNYVTGISFSTPQAAQRTLVLSREGLANLTASFSLSASDVTSALGYTPFNAVDFTSENITNALGYVPLGPANFIAGTNITLSSTATSLTINSSFTDTTGPNNYVTGVSFSDASSTIKTLTLTREGLSNLTASFSLSAENITSALGYTPFNSADFTAANITNALGYTPLSSSAFTAVNITNALGYVPLGPANFIAGTNITLSSTANSLTINATDTTNANNFVTGISFSTPLAGERVLNLSRTGLSTLTAAFTLTQSDITTSLGYTPLSNSTDFMSGSLGVAGSFSAATGSFTNLTLANALGVIYGGTGLTAVPQVGQILIGNGTGYTLAPLTAGTGVTISTGAGSITISSALSDTNNFVTGISFSDASSTTKTLTLTRDGLSNLTASFSLSAENITSALGYTPLRNTSDTMSGSLTILQTLSATDVVVADNFFISDYANSNYTAQIEPKVGTINRKLILDLISGTQTETTLGMFIQSVRFSAPTSADLKNLTFNVISSDNNINLDILTQGTIPTIFNNVLDISTGTIATGYFSSPLADKTFNFQSGTISASNLLMSGNSALGMETISTTTRLSITGSTNNSLASALNIMNSSGGSILFVRNDGDIGIGTTNPSNPLTVVDPTATAFNNFNKIAAFYSTGLSNGSYSQLAWGRADSLYNQAEFNFYYAGNSSPNNRLQFGLWGETNILNLLAGGNVGINESNPGSKLTVRGSTDNSLASALNIIDSSGNSKLLVRNDGGVGIGTTSPTALLEVLADGFDGIFINNTGNGSSLRFGSGGVTNIWLARLLGGEFNISLDGTANTPNFRIESDGQVGLGLADPGYRLDLPNTADVNGRGRANQWVTYSDITLKENISQLTDPVETLMALRGVSFDWKDNGISEIGFIAQEIETYIPEIVSTDAEGIKSLDYGRLTPILVEGFKAQQNQINTLSNAVSSINFASLETLYNQFMTSLENLSMSTENGALVVNSGLTVTGDSLFNNATFTGDVAVGQIKFDTLNNDISINGMDCTNIDGTLNTALCETQTLFVMKNKAGNLNFFDGKVVINPNGEMTIEKINAGEVAAAKVIASEYEVVAGSEVSGNTQILTGQTEITILTSKVRENSKVFVTANGDLGGRSLYVTDKVEGVSFKVRLNQALTSDINFDWFILNSE